jgi:hypothetical protein
MSEGLLRTVQAFRAALVEFEPGVHSGEACAVLVEQLAAAEKACAAARIRAAARAGACGAHRERGFADASDWLARAAGSSAAAAKAALDTAAALEALPETKAALEAGELSMAQAQEIELHALQHRAQRFRHWRTALGTVGFAGELPPEIGLPIMNRLDAETDRLWQRSRRHPNGAVAGDATLPADAGSADAGSAGAGSAAERRNAIAADAFVRLVETGGKGKARSADLVIVCDLQA